DGVAKNLFLHFVVRKKKSSTKLLHAHSKSSARRHSSAMTEPNSAAVSAADLQLSPTTANPFSTWSRHPTDASTSRRSKAATASSSKTNPKCLSKQGTKRFTFTRTNCANELRERISRSNYVSLKLETKSQGFYPG